MSPTRPMVRGAALLMLAVLSAASCVMPGCEPAPEREASVLSHPVHPRVDAVFSNC